MKKKKLTKRQIAEAARSVHSNMLDELWFDDTRYLEIDEVIEILKEALRQIEDRE